MTRSLAYANMAFFCLALAVVMRILPYILGPIALRIAMIPHLKSVIDLANFGNRSEGEVELERRQNARTQAESGLVMAQVISTFYRGLSVVFTVSGFAFWFLSTPPVVRRLRHE